MDVIIRRRIVVGGQVREIGDRVTLAPHTASVLIGAGSAIEAPAPAAKTPAKRRRKAPASKAEDK